MALNPERAQEMFARVFRDETADPEDRAEAEQAGMAGELSQIPIAGYRGKSRRSISRAKRG